MDQRRQREGAPILGALGIVFGDIGTSPLYTIKEAFFGLHPLEVTESNVLGILSLIFWSLIAVISIKYMFYVIRVDNRGEGGTFALLSLLPKRRGRRGSVLTFLGLLGAALLYGDGVITPAISVLSAVEGLGVGNTSLGLAVLPLTIGILVLLFSVQNRGTGKLAQVLGPVMTLWFITIGALGLFSVLEFPVVLRAVNPVHALQFFIENGFHGFLALGSVVLCLTGAEALYADLGHFGKRPIRAAWFSVAFPSLLLNYAGQGAILLADSRASHPFYAIVPELLHFPMVLLATLAAIIASQALISGAFSLTRQAAQLGYLPRVHVIHTSGAQKGRVYIPGVNRLLAIGCILVVLLFQKSTGMAAAYGVAVTGNMVITSLIFFHVSTFTLRWSLWRTIPLLFFFLLFDLSFFGANLFKIEAGGWFPIVVATLLLAVMTTWREGRRLLGMRMHKDIVPLDVFIERIERLQPTRVPGTAVFMSSSPVGTPFSMLHYFKHFEALHENVFILSMISSDRPFVPLEERIDLEILESGFYRVLAYHGFMETPDVEEVMARVPLEGVEVDPQRVSYFLGRETLLPIGPSTMRRWRKTLFLFLAKNAAPATSYFRLSPERVVELGVQVEL